MNEEKTPAMSKTGVMQWLKSDITLTLPGWMLAAAAVGALLLVGIALD